MSLSDALKAAYEFGSEQCANNLPMVLTSDLKYDIAHYYGSVWKSISILDQDRLTMSFYEGYEAELKNQKEEFI